jgi:hypothetical protein
MKIPVEPFERSLKYIDDTCKILDLSIWGITHVSQLVDSTKKLVELGEIDSEVIEKWKPASEFAKEQVKNDFPLLYAHSIVAIWGSLESLIVDFLVLLINKKSNLLENDLFNKIKIPLAEFELLDKEERIYLIIREAERNLKLEFKPGVERFEAFFNLLGIGGAVDQKTKKILFELFHVRNLILHRSSIVDQKFLKACPWRKENRGDILLISANDFNRYRSTVEKYINIIIDRLINIKSKKKNQIKTKA